MFSSVVILIENTQVESLLAVGSAQAPSLECTSDLQSALLIQIIGIEDERLIPRAENPSIWLLVLARSSHIIDFSNVEVAGPP